MAGADLNPAALSTFCTMLLHFTLQLNVLPHHCLLPTFQSFKDCLEQQCHESGMVLILQANGMANLSSSPPFLYIWCAY